MSDTRDVFNPNTGLFEQVPDSPSRPDLDELIDFWAPKLGLLDWTIRAEYDRTIDGLGLTTVWWRDREARVRICEPAFITRQWPPADVELTFVHELVHCIVEPVLNASKDLPLDLREQVVEQLAKGYVRLARRYPLADDWLRPRASKLVDRAQADLREATLKELSKIDLPKGAKESAKRVTGGKQAWREGAKPK